MRPHTFFLIQFCYLAALVATTAGQAGAGQLSKARNAARGAAPEAKPAAPPNSGKLDQAREAARPQRSERRDEDHGHREARRRPRRQPARHCGSWSFAGAGLWSIPRHTTYVIEQPVVVPTPVVGQAVVVPPPPAPAYEPHEPITPELRSTFAAFPHAGEQGFLDVQPSCLAKPWLGAVRFELGSDFDGLSRSGLAAQLEGSMGWGLDFKYDTYRESLAGGGYDELRIVDLNAMYRVVETNHSLIRVGMGVNFLGDAIGTEAGVNFTVKADFAPVRPFVLSTELDMGTVGHAETLHTAATLGVMTDRVELFGGYDYRRVGDAELQGPMLGLRLWF